MGKCDSLQASTQDYLAGRPGAFEKIRAGLDRLIDAGFTEIRDPHQLRLGVSFVSCRMNLPEMEEIWHYCRENHIFPNMEVLTPTGRALETLHDQYLTAEEIREYKLRLLDLDRRRFGYDWLVYTPLIASGCLQHLYSLYITLEGNVRPCAPTKFDEHPALRRDGVYPYNAFRRPLAEIYHDPLFRYVRTIDKHLEGKCHDCAHLDECIGCRGLRLRRRGQPGQGTAAGRCGPNVSSASARPRHRRTPRNRMELLSDEILEQKLKYHLDRRQLPDAFLYVGDSGARNWLTLESSDAIPRRGGADRRSCKNTPAPSPGRRPTAARWSASAPATPRRSCFCSGNCGTTPGPYVTLSM